MNLVLVKVLEWQPWRLKSSFPNRYTWRGGQCPLGCPEAFLVFYPKNCGLLGRAEGAYGQGGCIYIARLQPWLKSTSLVLNRQF